MPTIDTIRQRFMEALRQGKTTEEATAIANGEFPPRRNAGTIPPPPATSTPGRDLAAARAEYTAATGKKYYHGWDYDELMRRIREAGES